MNYPSILYWKWDDSHIGSDRYLREIDDICRRSCFSHIYITTHWCWNGISTKKTRDVVANACRYIHEKGRSLILEIDARAEKADFVRRHPSHKMGFIYFQEVPLSDLRYGEASFSIQEKGGGDLFLQNRQSGETLLRVYGKKTVKSSLFSSDDITDCATVFRVNDQCVQVQISVDAGKYESAVVLLCSWLDFPDFFSQEHRDYFDGLFELYRDIPLDGVAVDELSFPNHPSFDFTQSSYMAWNDSPLYSYGMETAYRQKYGSELLDDYLLILDKSLESPERIRAINRYYELIRECICKEETYFYHKGKECFGGDTFIGVHPTWYAIDEVQNTPEVWKNGVDWWGVPRDFGFTDEIMLYPVRLALTHKSGGNIFYNMWYGEGVKMMDTFYQEMWRNIRYGGRTISLSYACEGEFTIVEQLVEPGKLEAVSDIEQRIALLDPIQKAPPASDILVIMGVEACCNILCNTDGNGRWNIHSGRLKEAFTLARDIWNAGYNCDLVGSYELYQNEIYIGEDGLVHYGSETFRYVIFAFPEFSKREVLNFFHALEASKVGLSIIGSYTKDFNGEDVTGDFLVVKNSADYYASRPEVVDLFPKFEKFNVRTYRVPNGSILQDGTVLVTAPAPEKPIGNVFETTFQIGENSVVLKAEDMAAIRLSEVGRIETLSSPNLLELTVNGKAVTPV